MLKIHTLLITLVLEVSSCVCIISIVFYFCVVKTMKLVIELKQAVMMIFCLKGCSLQQEGMKYVSTSETKKA